MAKQLLAFLMILGIFLMGCSNPSGNGGGGISDLSGTITIGGTPPYHIGTALTATYSGNETVTYQWKQGGNNVGTNSNTYTPTAPGVVTVTVSSEGYNPKTSAAVTVIDPGLLTLAGAITIAPPYHTGTALTATYSGSETVTYQWNQGGDNVGTNSNTYTPAAPGVYTVTVSAEGYNPKTSVPVTVVDADIVIVGAGVAGVSAAYEIMKLNPELKVVLLDKLAGLGTPNNSSMGSTTFMAIKPSAEVITAAKDTFEVTGSGSVNTMRDRYGITEPFNATSTSTLIEFLDKYNGAYNKPFITNLYDSVVQYAIDEMVSGGLTKWSIYEDPHYVRAANPQTGIAGEKIIAHAPTRAWDAAAGSSATGSGSTGMIVRFFYDKAVEMGVEVRFNSLVTELLGDSGNTTVTGVEVNGPAGEYNIMATAVIMATGGYSSNSTDNGQREWWQSIVGNHYQYLQSFNPSSNAANTGDMIKLTRKFNAPLYNGYLQMGYAGPRTLSVRNADNNANETKTIRFMINQDGKRYMDEYTWNYNFSYRSAHQDMRTFAVASLGDKNFTAAQYSTITSNILAEGWPTTGTQYLYGATLADLADRMGMSTAAKTRFLATTADYNAAFAQATAESLRGEVRISDVITPTTDYEQPTIWMPLPEPWVQSGTGYSIPSPLLPSGGTIFGGGAEDEDISTPEGYIAILPAGAGNGSMGGPQVDYHMRMVRGSLIPETQEEAGMSERVIGLYGVGEGVLSSGFSSSNGGPYPGSGFGVSYACYGGLYAARTVIEDFFTP
jgi:hypothetical protein